MDHPFDNHSDIDSEINCDDPYDKVACDLSNFSCLYEICEGDQCVTHERDAKLVEDFKAVHWGLGEGLVKGQVGSVQDWGKNKKLQLDLMHYLWFTLE